jgi:hypothetical protein
MKYVLVINTRVDSAETKVHGSRPRPNWAGACIRLVMNSRNRTLNRRRSPAMKNQIPSSPTERHVR